MIIYSFKVTTSQVDYVLYAIVLVAFIVSWFSLYRPFLSPLSSLLYVRFTLKTSIDWDLAKQLSPLLRPNFRTNQWFPLRHVKELPAEKRVEALQQAVNHYFNESWV